MEAIHDNQRAVPVDDVVSTPSPLPRAGDEAEKEGCRSPVAGASVLASLLLPPSPASLLLPPSPEDPAAPALPPIPGLAVPYPITGLPYSSPHRRTTASDGDEPGQEMGKTEEDERRRRATVWLGEEAKAAAARGRKA